MTIYPAVDISGGRCVRLRCGDRRDMTDYGDPVEVAARYRESGAQYLHLVDLDGAFGTGDSSAVAARISNETGLPVQVGGGIRTRSRVDAYLNAGVSRVIMGTAAIEDPDLVRQAAQAWPGRVAVGIDARGGRVAVRGWLEQSEVDVLTAVRALSDFGIETFIYTDIARDGMMAGPDVAGTRRLVEATTAQVIGSGGVSRLEDVRALRAAGAAGVIIGRALLDGAFTLAAAVDAGREPC